MSEWTKYKFSEFAELRKEQVAPNGIEQPYIGLEHIEQQSLRLNGVGSSNEVISNKFKFYSGDVLYGKLRPYFRKVYKPKFEGVCSTDIFVIKNKELVDKTFLFYLVATEEFTGIANSGSSGTRMPRAEWSQLAKSEWQIPSDINEQKEIASILSSLDDKIELNLQMNQTLEAMAQAIFKEWFVHFNFPDFDGELVDGLPKGWTETTLNKVIDLIIDHRGKTPTKLGGEWVDVGIPAISAKNVKDGRLVNLSDVGYVNEELYNKWMKEKLQQYDILLTSEGPLGEVALLISNNKYCLSQRLFAIRVNSNFKASFLYLFLRSASGKDNVSKRATGSTVVGIRQSELRMVEVLMPGMDVQVRFDEVVRPLLEKIDENYNEINILTQIRDSLLPKLMSGKIEIQV